MINVDVYSKNMSLSVCLYVSICLFVCFILHCYNLSYIYRPHFPFFNSFLSLVPPPVLLPIQNQTVTQGLNVTFTCTATVGFGLSYLWIIPHLNCVDCGPVALNVPTITLTDITNEANGLYTCTVTDFVNQTATTSAVLTVVGTYLIYNRTNYIHSTNNCFYIKVYSKCLVLLTVAILMFIAHQK